jgi:hypothetical protein
MGQLMTPMSESGDDDEAVIDLSKVSDKYRPNHIYYICKNILMILIKIGEHIAKFLVW